MGERGSKLTATAGEAAENYVAMFSSIEKVSSRKMFGGYGIFQDGKMFAIVNSKGELFFKADDSNIGRYEEMGSEKHGKMPYFSVPGEILEDEGQLVALARLSVEVAHS